MARIGYCKLGRALPLDPANWGVVGGDDEPPLTLKTLARRRPQDEFVIIGRNSGEEPSAVGLPSNVTNAWHQDMRDGLREASRKGLNWLERTEGYMLSIIPELFADLDAVIVWAGQHGTSNSRILKVKGEDGYTKPQDAFIYYCSFLIRGINFWRNEDPLNREEIWLLPDPRNYVKARDLKWPLRHPILGQFDQERKEKHYRFGDATNPADLGFPDTTWDSPHAWHAPQRMMYSRLEICGITPEHVPSQFADNFEERTHFGLFINEARAYVAKNRKDALRDWVLPCMPTFIHGSWSDASKTELGIDIQPAPADVYYDKLRSVKTTLTTPSSGSGWATTKPWQSFATGTVCFFHPEYDTQGHIIPTAAQVHDGRIDHDPELKALAQWLRPATPERLKDAVKAVASSRDTWLWLATAQRRLYDRACAELDYARLIDERLDG